VNNKGTAMGVYSTSQFSGIFFGGVIGGLVLQYWGVSGVFVLGAIMSVLLLLVAISLPQPDYYKNTLISLKDELLDDISETTKQLLAIDGVMQVAVSVDEKAAYLKVDKLKLNSENLKSFS